MAKQHERNTRYSHPGHAMAEQNARNLRYSHPGNAMAEKEARNIRYSHPGNAMAEQQSRNERYSDPANAMVEKDRRKERYAEPINSVREIDRERTKYAHPGHAMGKNHMDSVRYAQTKIEDMDELFRRFEEIKKDEGLEFTSRCHIQTADNERQEACYQARPEHEPPALECLENEAQFQILHQAPPCCKGGREVKGKVREREYTLN